MPLIFVTFEVLNPLTSSSFNLLQCLNIQLISVTFEVSSPLTSSPSKLSQLNIYDMLVTCEVSILLRSMLVSVYEENRWEQFSGTTTPFANERCSTQYPQSIPDAISTVEYLVFPTTALPGISRSISPPLYPVRTILFPEIW